MFYKGATDIYCESRGTHKYIVKAELKTTELQGVLKTAKCTPSNTTTFY
jgi:hypothetical protein